MLSHSVIDSLFPPDLPEPEHWERRYPPRDLPAGAEVTRLAPSPTGFLTLGGVYTAIINADIARQTGGIYLVRLEDTDQARLAAGRRRAVRGGVRVLLHRAGRGRRDRPLRAVHPVCAGGDLPDLRP